MFTLVGIVWLIASLFLAPIIISDRKPCVSRVPMEEVIYRRHQIQYDLCLYRSFFWKKAIRRKSCTTWSTVHSTSRHVGFEEFDLVVDSRCSMIQTRCELRPSAGVTFSPSLTCFYEEDSLQKMAEERPCELAMVLGHLCLPWYP